MSLVKLTPEFFERFTTVTNPLRTFVSSAAGVTGSVRIYPRTNTVLKDAVPLFSSTVYFDDQYVKPERYAAEVSEISQNTTNIFSATLGFFDRIDSEPFSSRRSKVLNIRRGSPGNTLTKEFQQKIVIRDSLMPHYRGVYPSANYAYVNYHSLNFFTASSVPSDSVIVYPVSYSGNVPATYVPTAAFTLDFYVNPRYAVSSSNDFKAGTIFHVSSTLSLSLVTGSQVNQDGLRTGFRLLLQLSSSADIRPSTISLTGSNNNRPTPHHLVFLSDDNSLKWNHWHHVSVRWGTHAVNHGTGSFLVDGVQKGTFVVSSGSVTTRNSNAAGLFLGNYFEGRPSVDVSKFFNGTAATNEGIRRYGAGTVDPTGFSFSHPLNAEIHDVKVFDGFRSIDKVLTSSMQGPETLRDLLFYLPVFFVKETFARNIHRTPVEQSRRETNTPLNADFSLQVGGHDLNIENFLREFVRGEYPRLYEMSASMFSGTQASGVTADDYFYRSSRNVRRSLSVLPCDNGLFAPSFELLRSGTSETVPESGSNMDRFVTDVGGLNLQIISLKNLITSSIVQSSVSGGLESDVFGANYLNPTLPAGTVPAVAQVTRDTSSNSVAIFNIPSLFYGRRILPKSFSVTDPEVTGSSKKISLRLKDDGQGGLYRADCLTTPAAWNSVGTVFYNEGVVIVKSPNIPFFGKDRFEITFKGERHIYVSKVNVPAASAQVNSSSNPSFLDVPVSLNANEEDPRFVYITGILFHDENLNVVGRSVLSQPVVKRSSDRIVFRTKIDY